MEITKKRLINDGKTFPLKVEEHLERAFSKLSPNILKKNNAALCADLLEHIQESQEDIDGP